METYIYKGCLIKIEQDTDPQCPRAEWDNQFVMVCFHPDYTLGDKEGLSTVQDWLHASPKFNEWWIDFSNDEVLDLDDPQDLGTALDRCGFITLPIYLYDHSGLTMNTRGFSCPWDSGQVGIIVANPVSVRKEHGWKRITPKRRELLLRWMKGEVTEYDKYLTGDVWGYIVTSPNETEEDSCWGFYGFEYCKEEAESVAVWLAESEAKQEALDRSMRRMAKTRRLKSLIRHHVPFSYRT